MCMHIYVCVCLYTIYMSEPHIHTFFAVWSFVHITFATNLMGKMPMMHVKEPSFIITQIMTYGFLSHTYSALSCSQSSVSIENGVMSSLYLVLLRTCLNVFWR